MSNMKISAKCDQCGKIIAKSKSSFKNNKHHFCNRKCYIKWSSIYRVGKNAANFQNHKIKMNCDWCGKILYRFKYRFKNKHQFCNMKCMGKWRAKYKSGKNHPSYRGGNRFKVKCFFCGGILYLSKWKINKKNTKRFCNQECAMKYQSKYKKGRNNPNYKKKIKLECEICGKIFYRSPWRANRSKYHICGHKCIGKWISKHFSGKNSPFYINGKSIEPYTSEFNCFLKEFIRKRDQYKCQNEDCGVPQKECNIKLSIHHIDYKKCNSDPINLIALCQRCHQQSNHNRTYWQTYYENIQIKRQVHTLEKYVT